MHDPMITPLNSSTNTLLSPDTRRRVYVSVIVPFQEVSEPAAEALVNLSQNSKIAAEMVRMGLVKTAMDVLYKPESSITRLLVMLLVNLTQLDAGTASLLQVCFSYLCVRFFNLYMKRIWTIPQCIQLNWKSVILLKMSKQEGAS